jgi:hypothetical protein
MTSLLRESIMCFSLAWCRNLANNRFTCPTPDFTSFASLTTLWVHFYDINPSNKDVAFEGNIYFNQYNFSKPMLDYVNKNGLAWISLCDAEIWVQTFSKGYPRICHPSAMYCPKASLYLIFQVLILVVLCPSGAPWHPAQRSQNCKSSINLEYQAPGLESNHVEFRAELLQCIW